MLATLSVLPMQPRSPGTLAAAGLAAAASVLGYACGVRRLGALPALALAGAIGGAAVLWLSAAAHAPGVPLPDGVLNLRAELMEVWAGGDAEPFVWQFAWWALAWATPFVAARAFATRGRAIEASGLLGGLLIGLLLAVRSVDLWPAAGFAAAALLLHVQAAATDRRLRWARRSMTASDGVSASVVMRGWLATGAMVVLAWALTSVAVASPLDVAWQRMGDWWSSLGARPALPGSLGDGTFAASFAINSRFDPSRQPVLRLSGIEAGTYLRVTTHARYTGNGWEQDGSAATEVPAGGLLHSAGSLEAIPTAGSPKTTSVRIVLDRPMRELALPGRSVSLSLPARPVLSPDGRSLVSVSVGTLQAGAEYEVLAYLGSAPAAELERAPDVYPDGLEPYLALDGASERTIAEARRLTSAAETPYARARALLDYLGSDPFKYSRQSFLPPPGSGQDVVDHFLFGEAGRRGFCEQFSSSMVLMARAVGIPARLARGYTSGEELGDGSFQVRAENEHAWAELYFPGHGWEVFEATPGIGPAAAESSVGPNASPRTSSAPSAPPSRPAEDLSGPPDPGGGIGWAPIAVLAVMLIVIAVLAGVRRRRTVGSRPAAKATLWWGAVDRAARRAGLARAPSQTTYEHAREIGHAIPRLDGDVQLLATAFVQEAYAGRTAERRSHGDLAGAWRRVARELRRLRLRRAWVRPSHR